jgi:gliding motility-associated-like protein
MKQCRFLAILLIFILATSVESLAQPCLTGWNYRVPITIDNTANASALSDHQVLVTVNTQDLVVSGKARISGQDIRFLNESGVALAFWIENDTYSATDTRLWVKVDNVPASSTADIYLFYGNSSATSLSNGDDTFELFDDFDGAAINGSKWNTCDNGGTISVSGGNVTFSSAAVASQKAVIESVNTFSTPVFIESDVLSVSNGQAFMGFHNGSDNGFAMNYERSSPTTNVMLMREINSDGGGCFDLTDVQDPINQDALSANTTAGTWSFAWFSGNRQSFSWPGQVATETRNEDEHVTPANVTATLGHINQGTLNAVTTTTGSFQMDWVRVRKYTTTEPTVSVGAETEINATVTASAPEEICEGGTLNLSATSTPSATYTWTGPNGFTSGVQNPSIAAITTAGSGTYTVTATVPSNCQTAQATVSVTVNATSVAGTLSGAVTVCEGDNTGTLTLSGQTGNVVRWEQSATGQAPWATIDNTSTSLAYDDLLHTTYYRAVVQNGVCNEVATASAAITVDPVTVPGAVTEEREVCSGDNAGTIRLTDFVGSVVKWQSKTDAAATWTDIANTDTTYTFNDLTSSTTFRAEVQSGVCAAGFSDTVRITVHPLPTVSFTADAVCLGAETVFSDGSSVASGSITGYRWDFGDSRSASIEAPIHVYDSAGSYNVTLTATTESGCEASNSTSVIVHPLPIVDFVFEDVCQRNDVIFQPNASIATGSLTSFQWDFGDDQDSTTATAASIDYRYDTTGTYQVKLKVTSNESCLDSLSSQVTIFPRATLSFSAPSVFQGQVSSFENNSTITTGNLTYAWRFGNGTTSERVNPTLTYAAADTFSVQVISTSSYGNCKDTLTQQHIVHPQVVADFTTTNVCLDVPATFVNASTILSGDLSYQWDFGDGATSTDSDPQHTYPAPGTYLVTLTATSELGSTDQIVKPISIFPEPVADFSTLDVCDTDSATFKSLATLSSGSLSYEWQYGDEGVGTGLNSSYLYDADGSYDVLHIVTTDKGCQDSTMRQQVVHPLPETLFSIDTVCHQSASLFVNETTVSSGSLVSYLWNFGDQSNSIETDPIKLYDQPGNYEVSLRALSSEGCEQTFVAEAVVLPNPVIDFSVEDVCFGFESVFVNRSNVGVGQLTYNWDFGDSLQTSSITEPSIVYGNPGRYDVKLVGASQFGCADSLLVQTEVFALPTIDAGLDQTVSKGYPVTLLATGGEDYFWTPGEALDFQGIASPEATPLTTTTFEVVSVDENGCEGGDEVTVFVEDDFLIKPANLISPDGNGINDTWRVINIESYPDAQVQIFDLWGRRIFETTDYRQDWQGTFGNDIVPEGEYFYLITSPSHERLYKGTITLLKAR